MSRAETPATVPVPLGMLTPSKSCSTVAMRWTAPWRGRLRVFCRLQRAYFRFRNAFLGAIENGNLSCVRLLVRRDGKLAAAKSANGRGVLHHAALSGDEELVSAFLKGVVDGVSIRSAHQSIDDADSAGLTAAHIAAASGFDGLVQLLIKAGANVDSRDSKARTMLHLASINGHATCVMSLIAAGLVVDAQDEDGCTALHAACCMGEEEVIQWLLEHEADARACDKQGRSAVHWAAMHGDFEILDCVLFDLEMLEEGDSMGRNVFLIGM